MNLIIDELRNKLTDLEAKAIVLKERDKRLEQMVSRSIRIMAEAVAWHEHYEGSISAAPWYCSMETFIHELASGPEKELSVSLKQEVCDA
jgi:flagellar biosynthesis regulator FlaF